VDETKIHHFSNWLQVTLKKRVLIFDLNHEEIVPVRELSDSVKLFDANNFVEAGVQLAYMERREDAKQPKVVESKDSTPDG